jgi:hypothetical protein
MAKKELASSIAPRYTVNGQPRFTWPGPLEVVSRCICRTLVSNLKCEEYSPLLWLILFGKMKVQKWRTLLIKSSRVVRASDSQCRRSRNCPGFDPSILRHIGIGGVADEAVSNKVLKKFKNLRKKTLLRHLSF